jgi:penicillin-binding protein 1A
MEGQRKYRILRWLALLLWLLLLIGLIVPTKFILNTLNGDLPTFEDLEDPEYDEASIIYDIKGTPFGKYYVENREIISYGDLNPLIVNSLLATEDIRFRSHSGIDLRALIRVGFKTVLLRQESSGGGSTLSQQLAKLLFKRPSLANKSTIEKVIVLLRTKVAEWITAARLEKSYTKNEIMAMYLNKFEFINGAHGIQAAAQTYFNKNQDKLNVDESALLVGMLKNPSLYNPLRFPENASQRKDIVLSQLKKYYDVSDLGLDTLIGKPVDMSNFEREAHDVGPAPYFRAELTKWLRNLFQEKGIKKADGTDYNIYTDGLKIYTTIDLNYQKHAEEAVRNHMEWLQDRYWDVWKKTDPWTFEADSIQKIIRKNTLDRKIKESDRYLSLHNKYLGKAKAAAQKKYGDLKLNENVLKDLISVSTKRRSWSSVSLENKTIKANKDAYRKLLDSGALWSDLKNQYQALQKDYKEIFKTKVPMQVFAYSEEGYKEVDMSPRDSVRYHNQHLQASLLSVHPKTGHIKAWVGGPGFNYFKYDHVNSRRQVGSTIKPFVYATAISLMGLSPCQEYEDIQYTIAPGDANFLVDEEWSPSNANEEFTGNKYNLYQGLLYSKNSITVRLVKEMGNMDVVIEMLDNAGIDKEAVHSDGSKVIQRVPSISLGAVDLTLKEMAGAYTSFANNGIYTEPIFVAKIEDKSGKIIYTGVPESNQAINPLYNGVMVDMLKNNVGSGYGLGVKTEVGGKTGTTNDYADGWFMSVAPDLVTGVWTGGDDKWIRFQTLQNGQGFVMARPIVQKYLKSIEADSLADFDSEAEFPIPPIGYLDLVDCEKYKQKSIEEEQVNNQISSRRDEFDDEFDEFEGEFDEEFNEEFKEDSSSEGNEAAAIEAVDTTTTKPLEQEAFDEEFEEFEEEIKPAKDTLRKPGGGGGR